jgi:phosphonate transport system permease protein
MTGIELAADGRPATPALRQFGEEFGRHRRRQLLVHGAGTAAFFLVFALAVAETNLLNVRFWDGLPRLGDYLAKTLPTLRWNSLLADIGEWFYAWKIWLGLLLETILIAFFATTLAVSIAFVLAYKAARNLGTSGIVTFTVRRCFEIARTVPELVWALIFVFAFGVGPLAGVLAIALHSIGSLGKLYSEAIENADMRPWEGMAAAGAGWWQSVRYALVPQVLPNIASYTLLRFEINVRSSSIIGYVGAGGLGRELRTVISFQEYESISALFLIIVVTVAVIDFACEKLRHRFIGIEARTA